MRAALVIRNQFRLPQQRLRKILPQPRRRHLLRTREVDDSSPLDYRGYALAFSVFNTARPASTVTASLTVPIDNCISSAVISEDRTGTVVMKVVLNPAFEKLME